MKILKYLLVACMMTMSIFAQETKRIALTFDDGPKAKITMAVKISWRRSEERLSKHC